MLSSRFAVAVHVLALLALESGRFVASPWIAASVGTNPALIRRLLGRLRQAGLVESERGTRGGVRLALPAELIRLSQVYQAVEREALFPMPRSSPSQRCPVGKNIRQVLSPVLAQTSEAVEAALDRSTIAEVSERIRQLTALGQEKLCESNPARRDR
jgi:Rrf2 family protein